MEAAAELSPSNAAAATVVKPASTEITPAGIDANSADAAPLRPLHRAGAILLLIMIAAVCVRWITHPVHRASIEPQSTHLRININTADVPTLSLLSGISTTISNYIIEHREKHGPFRTLADLDKVNRIGPTTIQKIAPYITFE
jgi:competence ComEA-like helix-hairpin-helix protein